MSSFIDLSKKLPSLIKGYIFSERQAPQVPRLVFRNLRDPSIANPAFRF